MKWGLPISLSFLFWSLIGLIRLVEEKIYSEKKRKEITIFLNTQLFKKRLGKVAICIAAKNEQPIIQRTINSVKRMTSLQNCFVVSDGSTDKTAEVVRKSGCRLLVLKKSVGKGPALNLLLKHYKLLKRYDYVMFLDADTRIGKNYLLSALKIFEDKKYVAIAGYAKNQWKNNMPIEWKYFLIAYRTRLYSLLQFFTSYGQTWKILNVLPIIPGFASMYRTSVLKKLSLNTPGIIIEDFNLTFQLRKKRLGLVAHHPSMYGVAQDPTNLGDYIRQVQRWNLGFFQTVKTYGLWASFFWISLLIYIFEGLVTAIFLLLIPFSILTAVLLYLQPLLNIRLFEVDQNFINVLIIYLEVVIGVFIADYLLTIFIALKDKKPLLAFYGLGFMVLRFIDAVILLLTSPKAFFTKSQGIWTSPKRA